MRKLMTAAAILAGAVAWSGAASAADHEIKMMNKGPDGQMMEFVPSFLHIQPGDTVTFVPADKSHNSESIPGMIPEGAEGWKGKINDSVKVTFEKEGVYGFKCLPHYGMGMVGLIAVGDDLDNLDEAEKVKHPGKAGERMAALEKKAEAIEKAEAGHQKTAAK